MRRNVNELIEKFRSSGLTQRAFGKQHSIPLSTLQYHLRHSNTIKNRVESDSSFIPLTFSKPDNHTSAIAIIRGSFTADQIADLIRRIMEEQC